MTDGMNPGGLAGIGKVAAAPLKTDVTTTAPDGPSFKDVLFDKIDEVNSLQKDAETAMMNFASGKTENVSEMFVAVQKADLAFKTLMAIRNKLFDAYKEINQLRI